MVATVLHISEITTVILKHRSIIYTKPLGAFKINIVYYETVSQLAKNFISKNVATF